MTTSVHKHVDGHLDVMELRPALTLDVDVVVDVHVDVTGFFIWLRVGCSVKIRRIRVDPRAIGIHDGLLIDADSAALRG